MTRYFAKKRFGQNFLIDQNYLTRIAEVLNLKSDDHIIEIGAGRGELTRWVLPKAAFYDAIEIDRDLFPLLRKMFTQNKKIHLHHVDALLFDFKKLYRDKPMRIIGNLPYNISSPLIFHLLKDRELIEDMHFMLQKEVVDRLVAQPKSKIYGRLSVMTQLFCENKTLFNVPFSAFSPRPKVLSAFVRMSLKKTPSSVKGFDFFSEIVKEAFTYRRKKLRNSLKRLVSSDTLEKVGIDPACRAEELSVDQFVKIANEAYCQEAEQLR